MTLKPALILIVFAHLLGVHFSHAQSSDVIGGWKVDITFGNGEARSFHFEARSSGKGFFVLLNPMSKAWGPARPSDAEWTQGEKGSVTFSGPVEFPLGNIGRNPGRLILKGKFGTEGAIMGAALFFSLDQDPKDSKAGPSKSGSFKAIRATGG